MAAPTLTYTLTNGQTADASQVMQNFNDLLNGITDGTKDLSISALTCAGTATLNGHVNLGNSSADDLTVAASLASNLAIKTNNTYGIGSSTLGLSGIYLGNGGAGATCRVISASHSAARTYTIPDAGADANIVVNKTVQTFCDGIKLDDDGSQSTLAYYREYTATGITFSGSTAVLGTNASATLAIVRIGSIVTGRITITSGTSPGATNLSSAAANTIPDWAQPVATFYGPGVPSVFSVPEVMYIRIGSDGSLSVDVRDYSDGTRNAAPASTTLEPYMFSYPVDL